MINTNAPTEIDSFKLRIPYIFVEITNYKLEAFLTTTYEGGEIDAEKFKRNSLKFKENGISTRFAVERLPIDSKGGTRKYLTMLINSKHLKSRYLEGITNSNIDIVHSTLMDYGVAKFDLKTMLEGFVTDVDFKTDFISTMEDFQHLKKFFKINSRESIKLKQGYLPFNEKTNQGMQFSTRDTRAYKTNPFVKMYHKELELKYNSTDFYEKYLKGQNIKDLGRFETTIKNNAHMKTLGITSNTLSNLLNLDDSFKKGILSQSINAHLESNIKQIKIREGMSPLDEMLHNLIVMQMNGGMSFDKIRDFALSTFTEKTRKSKAKSKFNAIYEEHIRGTKKDISTKNIDSILNLIGVDNDKR
jgi:hypothetical protein